MRIVPFNDSRSCTRCIAHILQMLNLFVFFFLVVPSNFNLRWLLAGIISNGILVSWLKQREMDMCHLRGQWPDAILENEWKIRAWMVTIGQCPIMSLHRRGRRIFIPSNRRGQSGWCHPPFDEKAKERTAELARAFQPGLWNPRDPIWRGIRSKRPRHSLDTRPEPRVHALCWNVPRCTTGN